jgi:poly(3-hydroxyalkanoate) synthetase
MNKLRNIRSALFDGSFAQLFSIDFKSVTTFKKNTEDVLQICLLTFYRKHTIKFYRIFPIYFKSSVIGYLVNSELSYFLCLSRKPRDFQ